MKYFFNLTKPQIWLVILSIVLLVTLIRYTGSASYRPHDTGTTPVPTCARQEKKTCPDGAQVGHVPPGCEMGLCPGEIATPSAQLTDAVSPSVTPVLEYPTPRICSKTPKLCPDGTYTTQSNYVPPFDTCAYITCDATTESPYHTGLLLYAELKKQGYPGARIGPVTRVDDNVFGTVLQTTVDLDTAADTVSFISWFENHMVARGYKSDKTDQGLLLSIWDPNYTGFHMSQTTDTRLEIKQWWD